MRILSNTSSTPNISLRKMGGIIAITVMGKMAVMIKAFMLVVVLIFAVVGFTYLMWKTRGLRILIRNLSENNEPTKNDVIEGEVISVDIATEKNSG